VAFDDRLHLLEVPCEQGTKRFRVDVSPSDVDPKTSQNST
jgi:hypothetical protein